MATGLNFQVTVGDCWVMAVNQSTCLIQWFYYVPILVLIIFLLNVRLYFLSFIADLIPTVTDCFNVEVS